MCDWLVVRCSNIFCGGGGGAEAGWAVPSANKGLQN